MNMSLKVDDILYVAIFSEVRSPEYGQ